MMTLWGGPHQFHVSKFVRNELRCDVHHRRIVWHYAFVPPIDTSIRDTYSSSLTSIMYFTVRRHGAVCRDLSLFPKVTGRYLNEPMGQIQFWLYMIGFNLTFSQCTFLGSQECRDGFSLMHPTKGGISGIWSAPQARTSRLWVVCSSL